MEKGGRGERQGREKGEEDGDPEKLKKRRGTREEGERREGVRRREAEPQHEGRWKKDAIEFDYASELISKAKAASRALETPRESPRRHKRV